jgi:cytochrome P450
LHYWEYLCALVERRRQEPQDDFSSVLANYVREDGSTPSTTEIASHVNTILGAGFETTAQMMSLGVMSLLQHRDQWELLKSDRSLLPMAVEECLRHHSVVRRTFRIALTDVEVGGVQIPEGALVALMIQAANRDESAFTGPERFDITRRDDNLAFGRGMHFCLGSPLAKLELRITLETLLELAPDMQLVAGHELEYRPHIVLALLRSLYVDLGPVPEASRRTARAGGEQEFSRPRPWAQA